MFHIRPVTTTEPSAHEDCGMQLKALDHIHLLLNRMLNYMCACEWILHFFACSADVLCSHWNTPRVTLEMKTPVNWKRTRSVSPRLVSHYTVIPRSLSINILTAEKCGTRNNTETAEFYSMVLIIICVTHWGFCRTLRPVWWQLCRFSLTQAAHFTDDFPLFSGKFC